LKKRGIRYDNKSCNDDSDKNSGFLWGDGAAAVVLSNERYSDEDIEVIDINTTGLGTIGKSIDGVFLKPGNGGLKMPFGKDVFQYACTYMIKETEQILHKNDIPISQLNYLIPHQANVRIIDYVRLMRLTKWD
jgi:3-oxoacyl-[acyl-carrier-protein] synthase-3